VLCVLFLVSRKSPAAPSVDWTEHPLCLAFYSDAPPIGAPIYDTVLGEWNLVERSGSRVWVASPPHRSTTRVDYCVDDLHDVCGSLLKLASALGSFFVVPGKDFLKVGEVHFGSSPEFRLSLVHPGERRFLHCGKNVECAGVPPGHAVSFHLDADRAGRISFDVSRKRYGITVFDRFFVFRVREDVGEMGPVPA